MASKWPKIIRDPVHNVISFEDTPGDRLLLNLINCKEFQRLRRIRQLGLSELVFPGANHTRFAHSIGVMRTAKKFLKRCKLLNHGLNDDQETFILCAALLHDVGHGPFSHAFESVTKDRHETRTLEIIKDPSTEINQKLRVHDASFPDQLGMFFDEDWEEPQDRSIIPPAYTEIVSSQLDADRFDYLLRDSISTGAEYGRFDLEWILEHLHFDKGEKRSKFFVSAKAMLAAEAYIFARYHMYRTVYFHKTTRAAEVMLKMIFRRLKALIDKIAGENPAKTRGKVRIVSAMEKIAPGIPPGVVRAFSGNIGLDEYLCLDDFALNEFFKACAGSQDKYLQELGSGLLNRRLYKGIDLTDIGPGLGDFAVKATDFLKSRGADTDYELGNDTPADTPYKPYDPDQEKPAAQIYVEDGSGKVVEISTISDPVRTLQKKYQLVRYYFPERYRTEIQAIATPLMKK
jgi:HD superfamily phosphohydrolase